LLEAAADLAIAACGGDAREAVKALIVANHFLEAETESRVMREGSCCRVIVRIGMIEAASKLPAYACRD
jgi:hypothetical protein